MWKGPAEDPGGGGSDQPSSQELTDLKDQFEQQQVLIAQLKEMIRKSEQSSVTQEKVDEYMNTLSKRSGRAKKSKKDVENSNRKTDIPASQKITLLRQQVEENKLKFAERGKSKKGIEEMVTQLKAQLDDSQNLIPVNLSQVEYSEESSSQELHSILLSKEKQVTDLLGKVQKLEANVIDLQDSLKEKDSVIEARTKAITLMTENLSRKGKNTLDALDETKEQMRKMQENFIKLEEEMKARQRKLLEDLRLKNYEIAELQEINSKLEKKFESSDETDFETLRTEKDNVIKRLREDLDRIKTDEDEFSKLKKQLDDTNKNMIKVKAQHKSKVKDLTKQVEAFKKISDVNAEVVKLQAENCRLSQKVAELEEDKGSFQLKLVESESGKGVFTEREREMEEKIQRMEEELKERDKIISFLDGEIFASKTELSILTEKANSLSHLQSAQVTSEMTSIQFEEQMESLENEQKLLISQNEEEKRQLLEKLETLTKEKLEISSKLESYIQENMELVDKLEKLSAEKVSSAESIEIVEGLTQQEKLELEAYQKSLDLKTNEDLNESVNELNEETSDLLRKIELFTEERREVMEKMEELRQENNNLNLRIKEIENNRDILAETYEHLQNEKEAIQKENDALKDELSKSENVEEDLRKKQEELEEIKRRFYELEDEIGGYKSVIEEKKTAVETLSNFVKDLQEENLRLSSNIIDLNRSLVELEGENSKTTQVVKDKDEEIVKLREELNNKDEKIRRVTKEFQEKYLSLQKKLEQNSDSLQDIQKPLEAKVEELNAKNKEQLEKMKKIAANLKKKTQAYQELEEKQKEEREKWETEGREKDVRIESLVQQLLELEAEVTKLQSLETEVNHLQLLLNEKSNQFDALNLEFGQKLQELKLLDEKNSDLQNVILELKNEKNETNLQQELLQTRSFENNDSIKEAKIRELEMIIETQEVDLTKYKERVNKLEEGISFIEDRRSSLEKKAMDLGAKLEETSMSCEEMSLSESHLERRLAALTAHDETIEKKLEEAVEENAELMERNRKLAEKNEKFKRKLEQTLHKLKEVEVQHKEDAEAKDEGLKLHVQHLEGELKAVRDDYENLVQEAKNDLEKLNTDWQIQFDGVLREKNDLMVKFEEEVMRISENDSAFNDELIEYKEKLERSQTEIRNYEEHLKKISSEKEQELAQLREVIAQKDSELGRITSEKEKELQELRGVIVQKDNEIDGYKTKDATSFFDNLHPLVTFEEFSEVQKQLEEQLQKNQKLQELESQNKQERADIQQQLEEQLQKNQKLQELESRMKQELADIQQQLQVQLQRNFELEKMTKLVEEELQEILVRKDNEIEERLRRVTNEKERELQQLREIIVQKDNEIEGYVNKDVTVSSVDVTSFFDNLQPVDNKFEELSAVQKQLEEQLQKNQQLEELESQKRREFTDTQQQLQEQLKRNAELEEKMTKLVTEAAEVTVDSVIIEAEEKISPKREPAEAIPIPAFVWSDQANDPFDFIAKPLEESVNVKAEAQSELQDKIKTLEFMLYNAEKDKEDALVQCHQLTDELGTLLYERENKLQSQVLTEEQIKEAPGELEKIEFEQVTPYVEPTAIPVSEEIVKPEAAYLCFNEAGENDDGWGWGPEEAKLEEEHAAKSGNSHLEEKVRVLELERENHLEEIKQLQIKSGKLIKKLRELKQKNDTMKKSDLFNLDDTIQEELKLQTQEAERRLKEARVDLEKERAEKGNLSKRVEVLTAANERMVEMKERQDVEVLGWQRTCHEMSLKLQQFEWGDGELSVPESNPPELNQKIEELNNTIKDLTVDNEELQALLEEQRTLRIEAEKAKPEKDSLNQQLQILHERLEAEAAKANSVLEEKKNLQEILLEKEGLYTSERDYLNQQLNLILEERRNLEERVNEILLEKQALLKSKATEEQERDSLNQQLNLVLEEKKNLQDRVSEILFEKEALSQSKATEDHERILLNEQLNLTLEEKKNLQDQVNELIKSFNESREKYTQIWHEKEALSDLLLEKDMIIEQLNLNVILTEKEKQSMKVEKDELFKNLKLEENCAVLEYKQRIDDLMREKDIFLSDLEEKGAESELAKQSLQAEISKLRGELNQQTESSQLKNLKLEENCATLEYEQRIDDLMREKDILLSDLEEKTAQSELAKQSLQTEISNLREELDKQIKSARRLLEQNEMKEGQIKRLTEEWQLLVDQRGIDVAESWRQHLQTRESEFANLESGLKKEIDELEEKCNALVNENNELRKNVDAEIRGEVDRVTGLQQQINERQQYINDLSQTLQERQREIDELRGELRERDARIESTQVTSEEETLIVNSVLNVLREVSNVEVKRSKDSVVEALATIVEKLRESEGNVIGLQETVVRSQKELLALQQTIDDLTAQLHLTANDEQLQEKIAEIQRLLALIQVKDSEVANLKQQLDENERRHCYEIDSLSRDNNASSIEQKKEMESLHHRLVENESRYEELLSSKDSDIGMLQAEFGEKINECDDLRAKLNEHVALADEETKQLVELRAIIEEQVMKIEELKKELYQKSQDYDSLIAEVDIGRSGPPKEVQVRQPIEEDLTEPVSRAELDLALYMLHQRDVRCEELTVELTQLLEERDTLQLRLSNAIREKEELGKRTWEEQKEAEEDTGAVAKAKLESVEEGNRKRESEALATKLSELRTVGYKKDKTIVDEQDLRRLQELSIMQQHRDVASRLPAEAAARLVDASYTLSRDVQSPSKVLLNWLWGKSTPKVNDI